MGEDLNNFYYNTFVSIYGDDPDPDVNAFIQEMVDLGEPPFSAALLGGAQSIQAIADAIEATGGTDAVALANYLEGLGTTSLVFGDITLNADNHTVFGRPHRMMGVTDSQPAYKETRTASSPAVIR